MTECIICATEYEEGSIEICSNCGFDLTPFPEFIGEYPTFWLEREQTQVNSVRQMWVNFQETKQKLLETLTTQSQNHKLEIQNLNSQLEQNKNRIIELNNQVKKLEKSYVDLREVLNRKIRDLAEEKDSLEEELKRRNVEVDKFKNKIKELEQEKVNLRQELAKTVDKLDKEKREKTVIQSQLKSAEESIVELISKNDNLGRRYEELESKFNASQKKFRDIINLKTFNFETVQLTVKEPSGLFGLVEKVSKTTETKIETRKIPKQAQYFTEDLGNGVTLEMIHIPGGSFMMGTDDGEIARLYKEYDTTWFKAEAPQHRVTLNAFYMGKYPITRAQYEAIRGENPSGFKGNNNPVEDISWNMAQEFCHKLSEKTGKEYQLPSEAQWEYACRAGTTTPFYFGETLTDELANYNAYHHTYGKGKKGKGRDQTTPVGTFPPNGFGLYDMHGNVWEWCRDSWHENYKNAPRDGSAWIEESSNRYVVRGGSWYYKPLYCRCADRSNNERDIYDYRTGFRIVLCVGSSS